MDLNKEYIVDILRYNNEGYGVCKVDNFIVFVLYALPLEKLKIKIDKIYNNYALGHIVEIIKESILDYIKEFLSKNQEVKTAKHIKE